MPKKIYKYILFSKKKKLFCIKETTKGYNYFTKKGFWLIDYTGSEITDADIELYRQKGYKHDPGRFIN